MYPVSATFKDYIKRNTVSYTWHGTIVDLDGNSYELTDENIVQNAGKITKKCSAEKLEIGTTCAAELEMNLFLDVDRYTLFGATVTLYFTLYEGLDANEDPITEDVPMGIFTIAECNQSNGQLSIIAYDDMIKLDDVNFSITSDNSIQTPHEWLMQICSACGVSLGVSTAQISAFPNGNRSTGFADCVSDAKTWRDVLKYLCTYLNTYAYIGRDGKLYLGSYKSTVDDIITSSSRYSSELSDFRTTYDGLYAIHKDSGIQEYVENENTNGLVLDLGTNPFLQFSNTSNRQDALQEIIDAWNGIYYIPYESTIPIMPHYDLGDVLKFTDNQADIHDIGAITELVCNIGGKTFIRCSGDNPKLADAQDRFSKSVAGLASEYSNGQEVGTKNFWLLHTDGSTPMTVGSTKTQVAEIVYEQKTDVQRMGFMFTCDGDLSASALIKVEITVDDEVEFTKEFSHRYLKGRRHIPCTWGNRITGKGTHEAKVYMTVTDSALKWSELA